jgi:hypothetical protein
MAAIPHAETFLPTLASGSSYKFIPFRYDIVGLFEEIAADSSWLDSCLLSVKSNPPRPRCRGRGRRDERRKQAARTTTSTTTMVERHGFLIVLVVVVVLVLPVGKAIVDDNENEHEEMRAALGAGVLPRPQESN